MTFVKSSQTYQFEDVTATIHDYASTKNEPGHTKLELSLLQYGTVKYSTTLDADSAMDLARLLKEKFGLPSPSSVSVLD